MNRLWIVLLVLPLCGCYSDQEKRISACQLDADKFLDVHFKDGDPSSMVGEEARLTELCMEARGYRFEVTELCESDAPTPTKASVQELIVINNHRAISVKCYVPMGWGARQIYKLEIALGRGN